MDPVVTQMVNTYKEAQARYLSSGDAKHKPAAARAKAALDSYVSNLAGSAEQTQRNLRVYVNERAKRGSEMDKVVSQIEEVQKKNKTIATDYLTAYEFNQPIPIDWSKYYIRLAVLAGLAGGIAVVVLTR